MSSWKTYCLKGWSHFVSSNQERTAQENSEITVWNRILRQGIRYRCLHTISQYNIQLILYSLLLPHFPLRFSGENFDSHIKINNWFSFLFVVPVMRCQGERIREWSVLLPGGRDQWQCPVSILTPQAKGKLLSLGAQIRTGPGHSVLWRLIYLINMMTVA